LIRQTAKKCGNVYQSGAHNAKSARGTLLLATRMD